MSTGITLTQQPPVSPLVDLRADDTAHRLWGQMAATDSFQQALVESVGELVGDLDHRARRETALAQLGVTALDGVYAGILPSLDTLDPQFAEVMDVTTGFGAPEPTTIGLRAPLDELRQGPLAAIEAADRTPTVAVELDDAFGELRADQQRDVVSLLADLADVCDVRVVCGRATAAGFRRRWHEHLPVSAPCNADPSSSDVTARVDAARADLDGDGRETELVRVLAETTSETASYHECYAESTASKSRVRQCIGRLADLGLVATFDGSVGRMVELLAAGREYLETLESEIGVQQPLSDCVSATGQSVSDSRVNPPAHEGTTPPDDGGDGRHRLPHYHSVGTLSRWHATATTAVSRDNGVALADCDWDEADDRGEGQVWIDSDGSRVVAAAEWDNPFQGWVSIARALADGRVFRHALDEDAFADAETRLGELFGEFRWMLRDSRCVGYLKDAATPAEFIDALREAEEHLCELTKRWKHQKFDCSPEEFRSVVTREALGLASTMVHLLDLADVDVVIEARCPNYRTKDKDDRRTLAKSIAKGAAIQSRYGEFAGYRQLFEGREDKRESAIRPTVDVADPMGEVIPSFVVTGPGVGDPTKGSDDRGDDLAALITDEIDHLERHEDAPEFAVHVPIDERAGERRQATARAVERSCAHKHLSPTRRAASWFDAFAATPYDAAEACFQLGAETKSPGRKLAHHDVRYALSTLDEKRLLPDMKPTIGAMFTTLLAADPDESLTPTDIENRGGPSARSVSRHADALAAFGVLAHDEAGWRLPDALPAVTTADDGNALVRDVVADAVARLAPDRYADPDDAVGQALFAGPGRILPQLRAAWPELDPWVRLVRTIHGESADPPSPTTATLGKPPTQTSLAGSAEVAG